MSDDNQQVEVSDPTSKNLSLAEKVERALIKGDLSKLSPEEAITYYKNVCSSVGLNPWTRPFLYMRFCLVSSVVEGQRAGECGNDCRNQSKAARHTFDLRSELHG